MKNCPLGCDKRIKDFFLHFYKCSNRNLYNTTYFSCKYNTSHIIHKDEYDLHISTCSNKETLELETNNNDNNINSDVTFDKKEDKVNSNRYYYLIDNILKIDQCSNIYSEKRLRGNLQMKYFQYKIEDLKLKELSNN